MMTTDDEYFKYLKSYVIDNYFIVSYNKLFRKLYDTEFVSVIQFDVNRELDALKLRNGFGDIIKPCSIFEVLIALSVRCEEQIMYDEKRGDRRGLWFWEMIGNMGLGQMDDEQYDEEYVDDILRRFLYHKYNSKDKRGCAFRSTEHPDLSGYELWYQMNFNLNDILTEV